MKNRNLMPVCIFTLGLLINIQAAPLFAQIAGAAAVGNSAAANSPLTAGPTGGNPGNSSAAGAGAGIGAGAGAGGRGTGGYPRGGYGFFGGATGYATGDANSKRTDGMNGNRNGNQGTGTLQNGVPSRAQNRTAMAWSNSANRVGVNRSRSNDRFGVRRNGRVMTYPTNRFYRSPRSYNQSLAGYAGGPTVASDDRVRLNPTNSVNGHGTERAFNGADTVPARR